MKTTSVIAGILLVVLIVTACSSPPSATTTSPLPTSPGDATAVTEQSPAESSAAFASPLLTPAPDWGTVTGRLVDANNGQPIHKVMVFLEPASDHVLPPVLYAPPNDNPRTFSDEQGYFVISDVPEGEYAVILYSPPFALQIVTHSDGERPQLITVRAGEVVDIETVKVQEFELP